MKREQDKLNQGLYIAGWCIVLLILLTAVDRTIGIGMEQYLPPCLFHRWTGLYCPGCGGTRAVFALLHGNIYASFGYHPLVPCVALTGIWFLLSNTIEKLSRKQIPIGMNFRESYLWIALCIIIVNCLMKNIALICFHVDMLAF